MRHPIAAIALRVLPLLLPLAGLPSCYLPDYAGPYSCTPDQGAQDCPTGWSCVNHLCSRSPADGAGPKDGESDGSDGMAPPPGDGGADAAPAQGCSRAGQRAVMIPAGEVWTCDGNFTSGQYGSLCAPGYHVCDPTTDDSELLAPLSLSYCDSVPGFYLAQGDITTVEDLISMMAIGHCPPQPGEFHAVLGCGGLTFGAVNLENVCGGLRMALPCTVQGDWSCDPRVGMIDVSHHAHQGSPGGTLCCKNNFK